MGRVEAEMLAKAAWMEHEAKRSLGMLRAIVERFEAAEGQKILVFVSAGMAISDRTGGRPDAGDLPMQIGQAAARARVTIYTLFIDPSFWDGLSAENRRAPSLAIPRGRQSAALARGLEQFTGAAGGAVFQDVIGSGEVGFERVLRETSMVYLIGVEPDSRDRDGEPHRLQVKVNRRGATVRARQYVVVPATSDAR
jgi:VWFA-related protein